MFESCVDKHGNPITFDGMMSLWAAMEYRRIAYTDRGSVVVSTVWLGPFSPDRLLFETMVFSNGDSILCEHSTTEADALATHARVVDSLS